MWEVMLCKPGREWCPIIDLAELRMHIDFIGQEGDVEVYVLTHVGRPGRADEYCASAEYIGTRRHRRVPASISA